jgi:cardiolipin synthase
LIRPEGAGRTLERGVGGRAPADVGISPTAATDARARAAGRRWWVHVWVLFLGALVLIAAGVLVHRISDVVRGRPVDALALADAPTITAPSFPAQLATVGGFAVGPGHDVTILTDAAVFDSMLVDLRRATRSITFATYFCEPGKLAERVAGVLAERARSGVEILFLVDGYGCRPVLRQIRPELEAAGVRFAVVRPLRWSSLERVQHRNHMRAVVIDGAVGYTGGFGLADEWTGESGTVAWRDTSVRFRGPAEGALQAAFLASWAAASGTMVAGSRFLPQASEAASDPGTPQRADRAGLLVSSPGLGTTPAERALAVTLASARSRLFITNSYFVPTPLQLTQLEEAARRGVDVRLLLPGPIVDHPTTRWAGRGYYRELLDAGVRIWEYRETMLHAKTLVADGTLSWIGTMNLDNRSTRLNDEDELVVADPHMAGLLEGTFAEDLAHAQEIERSAFEARPIWQRVRERIIRTIAPVL